MGEQLLKVKKLVDDHGTDKTVEIARSFRWRVCENPETEIASGANEALKHVTTQYLPN